MFGKIVKIILALVLCCSFVSAATVHGELYDLNFNLLENVVVTVDSTPQQTVVAKDGSYEFELAPGSYVITAKYLDEGEVVSYVREELVIESEGDYVFDIYSFPDYGSEVDFLLNGDMNGFDDIGEDFPVAKEEEFPYMFIIGIVALLGVIVLLYFGVLRKKKKVVKEEKLDVKEELSESNGDLAELIAVIKKLGGRTTQKEIRKEFPYSEAKVSLMISELVHDGRVKKIKKGRGNIIVLVK